MSKFVEGKKAAYKLDFLKSNKYCIRQTDRKLFTGMPGHKVATRRHESFYLVFVHIIQED